MYIKIGKAAFILCGLFLGNVSALSAQTIDQAASLALAQRQACMACHQVDSKRVGPPLRSIGERYAAAGEGDAMVGYLAEKIRNGGKGAWGAVPMPAQRQVSEENARKLSEWILSFGKAPKSD